MPKIDDYVQLAAQTAREISADGETWRSFLQTASTLYKYCLLYTSPSPRD